MYPSGYTLTWDLLIRSCTRVSKNNLLAYTLCSAVKTLGEPDDNESAAAWIQKLKMIQEEKDRAERRVIMFS